jgi:hypothetical protein
LTNHTRGTLTGVVLLLFVIRLPLLGSAIVLAWIGVELFSFCRRSGRRGNFVFSGLVAAFLLFLSYQGYVLRSNLRLIAAIESRGASMAAMSGTVLPGYVNYISLGRKVGDNELADILALDGLENIEFMVANGSQITNSGLLLLQRLKNLQHIYIGKTGVTQSGIDQLEVALPNCLIVFDPDG